MAELQRAGIVERSPGREVGSAIGHDDPAAQAACRGDGGPGDMRVARHVVERHGAGVEDEADIVGVRIVRTLRHEAHALTSGRKMALVAGMQMGGQEQPNPEAAEPVSMAPRGPAVARGFRGEHGLPRPVRRRDIRKGEADVALVLQHLSSKQVEGASIEIDLRICMRFHYSGSPLGEHACGQTTRPDPQYSCLT